MFSKIQNTVSYVCTIIAVSLGLSLGMNIVNIASHHGNITQAQTPQRPVRPTLIPTRDINQLRRLFPQRTLIPSQTFQVNLLECGTCLFVPTLASDNRLIIHLVKNNQVVLTFPQSSELVPTNWRLHQLKAVSFLQLGFAGPNEDGIILIAEYITGIGREGAKPFPITMVFQRRETGRGFRLIEKESRILSDRRVSTIAQAERILRNEFNYLP
ncbi:hypothetical protein [Calothrix sp. NIES-3974]|uniref:hypothetical protein n=1 Tax=Calothrix sp. NIES-3974 TaxID=2005462 RepID=UPI000B5DC8D1|nr:hypothetical protein [Calothrix sp. NIES-3974]BAZ04205.1 hypothetical protein NIES3974_08370 [Calothrix sp. NIES-3974]